MIPFDVPIGWVGLGLGLLYLVYLVRLKRRLGYTVSTPYVIDGDTIAVGKDRIRLHAIDAPEMSQAGGPEARAHLIRLIAGGMVTVEPITTDRFGRTVARVHGAAGDLGRMMVRNGFAIADFGRDYAQEELQARKGRSGLWARGGILSPSAHRAKMSNGRKG